MMSFLFVIAFVCLPHVSRLDFKLSHFDKVRPIISATNFQLLRFFFPFPSQLANSHNCRELVYGRFMMYDKTPTRKLAEAAVRPKKM